MEPGSTWRSGGHSWFCFPSTQQPSGILALWGLVGIGHLLSAVSITLILPSSHGVRGAAIHFQDLTSWASSARTRALPHGLHPQQDSGNKGPQKRCPFLTKPGIHDDFDMIKIPCGMSPVDNQGPSSLSCPAGTVSVLQSQRYTTQEGLGRWRREGQQRRRAR